MLLGRYIKIDKENNQVQLTTTEPATNSSFYLKKGFKGYNNAIYYMNYVCSQLYSNTEVGQLQDA